MSWWAVPARFIFELTEECSLPKKFASQDARDRALAFYVDLNDFNRKVRSGILTFSLSEKKTTALVLLQFGFVLKINFFLTIDFTCVIVCV